MWSNNDGMDPNWRPSFLNDVPAEPMPDPKKDAEMRREYPNLVAERDRLAAEVERLRAQLAEAQAEADHWHHLADGRKG